MKNMDRTSWIGVIACLALLFLWGWWNTKEAARMAAERAAEAAKNPKPTVTVETMPSETSPDGGTAGAPAANPAGNEVSKAEAEKVETTVLESDVFRLQFTNAGAGIQKAALKNYSLDVHDPTLVEINEGSAHPIAAFSIGPKQFDGSTWTLASKSETGVVYETTTPDGIHWQKSFQLPEEGKDPYEITMSLRANNKGKEEVKLSSRYLYVGSASPLKLNEISMHIGSSWMGKDGNFKYKTVDSFGGRKILGFGSEEKPFLEFPMGQLHWAAVNNQFFATILHPKTPYEGDVWISRFRTVVEGDQAASEKKRMFASETAMGLPKEALAPGESVDLNFDIYMGPKEYARLKALGERRERVMHYDAIPIFGWLFGWAIKPLASLLITGLVYIKSLVGNYGIAIILITILIRALIWPIYAKSARTMKRMSKLTPMMKELREKYADNPEKMNKETMKLYQTYGVNPLGGCLPMFIQLPVFLAFYRMLWSAAELRQENFLWVTDLSLPDTVYTIPGMGIDINPLPIIMGLTSFVQMAITPRTGDKTQQTLFMLMPLVFVFICYNFASALALYWTVSNAFSILQTWMTNKLPEPELVKRKGAAKKGFLQRMAEQAEAAKRGESPTPVQGPASRTKLPSERGDRHTKSKKKRR